MPTTQAFINGGDWDASKLVGVNVFEADAMAGKATGLKVVSTAEYDTST